MLCHDDIGSGRQVVLLKSLVNILIVLDLSETLGIDGLGRVLLLHNAENTVIKMLVEVLGVGEGLRASATLASSVRGIARQLLVGVGIGRLLPAVGRCLLNTVNGSQMTLEDIGAVKGLLRSRSRAWAKPADHCALVMCESVAVLVILASETLSVVLASLNRTLLGALILVSEHVSLEILEGLATIRPSTSLLLLGLITAVLAWCWWDELTDTWGANVGLVVHWRTVGAAGKCGLEVAGLEKW
jgi:hypothetical protein